MKYGRIAGIDKRVSRIAQGTIALSTKEMDKSFALLDAVFAEGCNTFDTAHIYGQGDCERVFGKWMAERGNREEVVVLAKGAHHSGDRKRTTPFDISADLYDTLARMRTYYVDIYLLHRDDPSVPVGPVVEALDRHKREGRIRVFGGSNWTHDRIAQANEYAAANGLEPFRASSPQFSLAEQVKEPWPECVSIGGEAGSPAREWYRQQEMPLFTWSTLARGFFSGRFDRTDFEQKKAEIDPACVLAFCYKKNFDRLDRAKEMAKDKGVSVARIALAYVMSQPLDIYALIGCQSGEEMRENVETLDVELTQEEMDWLDLRR